MTPYFSCPFVPYNRSSKGMPVPPPGAASIFPGLPPTPPVLPGLPAQPLIPVQPSLQPMYPPMGFPMAPGGCFPGTMFDTDDMMDDTDMGPLTASPGDPPPVLSNNPPTTAIVLFKELTGYPNYGNPSGNADILYTGNRGVWSFQLPPFLFVPGNLRAQIIIRAVLDDHANVPVSQYSASITINGTAVHTGALPLEHGVPAGGKFVNWRQLTFNVPVLRRVNRVIIVNTSTAGTNDWIGFDWMEMRFSPVSPT